MINDFKKFSGLSTSKVESYIKAGYTNPIIMEENTLNMSQIDIFSRMMADRMIFLGTQIDDYTSNIITSQLLYLEQISSKPIYLYINSPGGVIHAGYAIYDIMQYIDAPVYTYCVGSASSMAAVILASGMQRQALPHSRIMIHQPLGEISGQISDIEIYAKISTACKNDICNTLAFHTGKPYEVIAKDIDRDFWMTAEEAVEYGLIDSILKRNEGD